MDDGLDLSQFDAMAQSSVDNVGLEDVIKPEHNTPWSGTHHRHGGQVYNPSELPRSTHTRSEPAMKQDRTSEAADSGYYSQLANIGMQPLEQYNTNRPELENDYSYFQSTTSAKATGDRKSVASDGHCAKHPKERRTRRPLARCPVCGRSPKNQSDSKSVLLTTADDTYTDLSRKHELTHTRPYRCAEPHCNRKDGFATENDLQRHRKSVHNLLPTVGSTAGYICAACPPEGNHPVKFWPRRDNFKAHVKRKHPKYNEAALIEA
jgi:hypothetical protein